MTPEQAAWIRDHAWTDTHRAIDAAYPGGFYAVCACQHGICGACDGTSDCGRPRHDRCISRGRAVTPDPITHLTDSRCMVIGWPLWRAEGAACRYICPCPCPKTGLAQLPPSLRPTGSAAAHATPAADPEQLGLFEAVA